MRTGLLALSMILAVAGSASAAGFGLSGGLSLEKLPGAVAIEGDEPYQFAVEPPKPEPDFSSYSASIYPELGLCDITGHAAFEQSSAGAQEAIALQAKLAASLDKQFGAGSEEDYGDGDADDTTEESLLAGNASIIRMYTKDSNKLPKGIDGVSLFLQSEAETPSVLLLYYVADQDACLNERNKAIDAGL